MLSQKYRLKKRKEFNYIFKNGKSYSCKYLIINYLPTKLPELKVGFSVSKKIGNAVVRNKVKRRLREAFKASQPNIDTNYNYIFVARKGIENISYTEIANSLNFCLIKTKLMSEKND